ncbi:methionine--tRNA ligase [Bdellovibrio sp. HCB337]|uniref:methionine--tRNA ligase n=1 Tax=Bdellovibrio sp. HCB337 TaxID=3394358 RepID=UPI0039A6CA39
MSTATSSRKILMTTALPYANGYIHLGHLVEYLQADYWNRFQNMRGHQCVYICADDTHGTPIMVKAREQGITPEQLIAKSYEEHVADFKDFQVEFAHYGSTNSEENRILIEHFYKKFKDGGHITTRAIKQLYCNHDKMFLPDRFVKGTCPNCGAKEQYGDSCDVCAATYSPSDMKEVHCSICGTTPVLKDSESIFFKLNDYKKYLEEWIPKHTANDVAKKMLEWFNEDLLDLDISRDEPYFGFAIPGTDNKKFFYVWVDAPMGYMSTTEQWAKKQGKSLQDIWQDPSREIYHFIGKDIARFHTIFWPAFLKAADFKSPNHVFVHGHLMVNGEKMSKSKGTFIAARTYLNHLNPEFLRYYYATKLNGTAEDIDLNLEDFVTRVNSDLVGKITNLASRGAQMLKKKMDGVMTSMNAQGNELVLHAHAKGEEIAKYYEARDFIKATNEIRALADKANQYFDEKAPWKTLETDPAGTKQVLTATLNLFRVLAIYLKPVLPHYTAKVEKLFGEKPYTWADSQKILLGTSIQDYEHLASRIEADKVKAMVEESRALNEKIAAEKKAASTSAKPAATGAAVKTEDRNAEKSSEITFDDFMKVDLRIGTVVEAEEIKEADKLLRLKVDIGGGEIRQIISGIKAAYSAEKLVGRQVLVCVNLAPRKMKFGMSEGMVLAAGDGGSDLYMLSPDSGAKAGSRVK